MVAPAHAERVRHVVEPAVVAGGLVLEDVTVRKSGTRSVVEVIVDVTEDDEGDLDLDRVAEATRAVSDALDAADVIVGEYTLDVMSPGVYRPLTERRHWSRACSAAPWCGCGVSSSPSARGCSRGSCGSFCSPSRPSRAAHRD